MSSCRYFVIRNQLSNLLLEVNDSTISSGTPLKLRKEAKPVKDSQLFWEDNVTGTIRTKKNDMCIDVYGNLAVVGNYINGNPNQQWVIAGSRLQNRINPGWVLMQERTESDTLSNYSQKIIAGICTLDSANLHWTVDVPQPEFFRIKNKKTGLYLVQHGIDQVGLVDERRCLQMMSKALWYEHNNGALLSRSNNFVLTSKGEEIVLECPKGLSHLDKHWFRRDDRVVWSIDNDVLLDVLPAQHTYHAACARVMSMSDTQKWTFEPFKVTHEQVT